MNGPGTTLSCLLRLVGISHAGDCQCNERAALMDQQGADWCEQHLDEIVGWLQEEATRRKLPFSTSAARWLVKQAIEQSRRP